MACLASLLAAPALLSTRPTPRCRRSTPVRAATAPVIDGALDDAAWQGPELPTGAWRSYNPLHGDTIPQQTHVWIAYDDRYLYFAFQCDDPEPRQIKTQHHPPRQHLERRLGRPEPRRARHRPGRRTT